jgi:transposase
MLEVAADSKIYLCTGQTDMRKGIDGLSILVQSIMEEEFCKNAVFIFRGKQADGMKILWWDRQGFCLYYECLDSGKFTWPKIEEKKSLGIARAQLGMQCH